MFHLTETEWLFMIPFGLAVLFMLWVFWNFSLQLRRKRAARDAARNTNVGALRDAPALRPAYRPESVPLHPNEPTHLEFRRIR